MRLLHLPVVGAERGGGDAGGVEKGGFGNVAEGVAHGDRFRNGVARDDQAAFALLDPGCGRVEDAVNVGDMIWVKFMEIDEKGRWNLSRKDALIEIEAQQAAAKAAEQQ